MPQILKTCCLLKRTFTVLSLLVLASFTISGQESVRIKKISGKIEFDGIPDEQAWESVALFPLTMHRPNFGSEPSEISEVRIGYDDESLWIGAHLRMKDPSKIVGISKKRDTELFGFDAFGIILDSFNDNENGLAFFTAPTGIRTDLAISNDAVVNGPMGMQTVFNYSWNTFWDVKTTSDDKGWNVEMKIPFSSIKFKPTGSITTMGITVYRGIGSNTEIDTWPSIQPNYGYFSPYKPSLSGTITIDDAKPKRPVYISPYVLGGLSEDYILNDGETEYKKSSSPQLTAGIDVKYNVNSNLTLDLTANTDFAQVESDMLQVNMTRYSLFYPEKRKFFMERTSLFDFALGGMFDNLFYSRNIGISNGLPTKIYGGARLTGRMGKTDIGFLDMQTSACDTMPGENFGVLRLRRQVINQNSYIGTMVTSRIGTNGYRNNAYGVDGLFRIFGDDYMSFKWAQTYDSGLRNKLSSLSPSFMYFSWERRTVKGFAYRINYSYIGDKFTPSSGYLMRSDVHGVTGRLLYGWIPGNNSKLFNYNISINAEQFNRISDGRVESMRIFPGLNLSTKGGYFFNMSYQIQKEGVREDFNLSDSVVIKASDYRFNSLMIWAGTPSARKISFMENITVGNYYDGYGLITSSEVLLNLSSSLNFNISYGFNSLKFPHRLTNKNLTIHSLNLTAVVMLNTKLSASFMTQFVNTEKDLITNFRIRYNPREGNDIYLVYNDYRGMGHWTRVAEPPAYLSKSVMLKYVHTFIL